MSAADDDEEEKKWDGINVRMGLNFCNPNFRRIIAADDVQSLFSIDGHSGQLYIRDGSALDVNHLKAESVFFSVSVSHFYPLSVALFWPLCAPSQHKQTF